MVMSLSIIYTRAGVGIEAPLVTVETHLSNGLPSMSIVGLPEAAVKESKDRVRSALINSNLSSQLVELQLTSLQRIYPRTAVGSTYQ